MGILSLIDTDVRKVMNMKEPENITFECDDSEVTDLTDNFEEFHTNSYLRRNADPNKKYLTKNEADWKTVESFSDDFKLAMQDVRNSLEVSSLCGVVDFLFVKFLRLFADPFSYCK